MIKEELEIKSLELDRTPALDKDYRIKLTSRLLQSGKCQVKFYASVAQNKQLYGYLLVDAEEKLKQVIARIKNRLDMIRPHDSARHSSLFHIGNQRLHENNFLIFDQ